MKEFSPQQIEQTKRFFKGRGFPVEESQIDGLQVSYYVIPQAINPGLQDFALRMTSTDLATKEVSGIFGVSDSVPAKLRPYWAAHEVIEFTQIGINEKGRCALAEEKVIGLVPSELRDEYINRRITFFGNLVNYFRADAANYDQDDIEEAAGVIDKLQKYLQNKLK
jgi:hypothetical protein